jgi:hypothetical protein
MPPAGAGWRQCQSCRRPVKPFRPGNCKQAAATHFPAEQIVQMPKVGQCLVQQDSKRDISDAPPRFPPAVNPKQPANLYPPGYGAPKPPHQAIQVMARHLAVPRPDTLLRWQCLSLAGALHHFRLNDPSGVFLFACAKAFQFSGLRIQGIKNVPTFAQPEFFFHRHHAQFRCPSNFSLVSSGCFVIALWPTGGVFVGEKQVYCKLHYTLGLFSPFLSIFGSCQWELSLSSNDL